MAHDWDIKPRSEECATCGTPFEDGQTYCSLLVFGKEGYARADYCAQCWTGKAEEHSPYSTWQGIFKLPPPPPEEALKKETAETLLRRLIEDDEKSRANVIYILAVMLERKRILREQDVQKRDDGVMMRLYEHRKSGDTFLIRDPQLSLDELEPVEKEVAELLGWSRRGTPKNGGQTPEDGGQAPEDAERPTANDQ